MRYLSCQHDKGLATGACAAGELAQLSSLPRCCLCSSRAMPPITSLPTPVPLYTGLPAAQVVLHNESAAGDVRLSSLFSLHAVTAISAGARSLTFPA